MPFQNIVESFPGGGVDSCQRASGMGSIIVFSRNSATPYLFTIPNGCTTLKVTVIGGGGGAGCGNTAGGTSSFGKYLTATGGAAGSAGANGSVSAVSGIDYVQLTTMSYSYGYGTGGDGGVIEAYLTNLTPGETVRITTGNAGAVGGTAGCVIVEMPTPTSHLGYRGSAGTSNNTVPQSFPSGVISRTTYTGRNRGILFTRTTVPYNWSVPEGVDSIKVTVVGGGGSTAASGGTSSFGTLCSATGGNTTGTRGSTSGATFDGVNRSSDYGLAGATLITITCSYNGASTSQTPGTGGVAYDWYSNMIPGMLIRITVGAGGAGGAGAGTQGYVLVEY